MPNDDWIYVLFDVYFALIESQVSAEGIHQTWITYSLAVILVSFSHEFGSQLTQSIPASSAISSVSQQ